MRLTTYEHVYLSCNFTRHPLTLTFTLNALSRGLVLLLGYCSNFTLRHRAVWSGSLPVSISYSFCHSPL